MPDRERPHEGRPHGRRFGDDRSPEGSPSPRNPELPKPDNHTDDPFNEDPAARELRGRLGQGRDEDRKPVNRTEDTRKPENHTRGPFDRRGVGPERKRQTFRGGADRSRRERAKRELDDQIVSPDEDQSRHDRPRRERKHHRRSKDHPDPRIPEDHTEPLDRAGESLEFGNREDRKTSETARKQR